MCALFRKFIINYARPLCRGFYISKIEPYDKFALPLNSKDGPSTARKLIINTDGSVVTFKGGAHSGSFSWVIRDRWGVMIDRKLVYIPYVTDIGLLEALSMIHAFTSKYVQGSSVYLYSDCKPWVLKVSQAKEDLDKGLTVEQHLNLRAFDKPRKTKLLCIVAYAFVNMMYDHFPTDSGIYLIKGEENNISHHFANAARAYYWQKNDMDSEESYLDFEYLDFANEDMFFNWFNSIVLSLEGENSDKKSGHRPSVLLSKINALGRRNLSTYACCAAVFQKYELFSVKEILLRKLISNANAKNNGVEEQTEVLLLVEPIDEVALQNLRAYKENCVDISKEGFGGEIAEKETEVKQELGKTCDWIKKLLGDKVASACALASGFSATLDRLMKTQNSSSRRVLELNPDHLIIRTLLAAYKSGSEDEFLRAVDLLYDSALISSGFSTNLQLIYLYLVPADLTVEQLAYVIRKRIKLSAEKPIFIFVDNVLPPAGAIMSATHEEKKDDDGFCNI